MRSLHVLARALALLGVAPLFSPTVHADPSQDQAFLVALGAAEITYKDPPSAIAAGKAVCDMAHGGKSGIEVVQVLQDGNPGLTQVNAAKFTAIAANVYCPAQLPGVKPALGG